MSFTDEFIRALRQPKLERIEGIDVEPDASFRDRILHVCILADRKAVMVADAYRLDAIGNFYGLVRQGLR